MTHLWRIPGVSWRQKLRSNDTRKHAVNKKEDAASCQGEDRNCYCSVCVWGGVTFISPFIPKKRKSRKEKEWFLWEKTTPTQRSCLINANMACGVRKPKWIYCVALIGVGRGESASCSNISSEMAEQSTDWRLHEYIWEWNSCPRLRVCLGNDVIASTPVRSESNCLVLKEPVFATKATKSKSIMLHFPGWGYLRK